MNEGMAKQNEREGNDAHRKIKTKVSMLRCSFWGLDRPRFKNPVRGYVWGNSRQDLRASERPATFCPSPSSAGIDGLRSGPFPSKSGEDQRLPVKVGAELEETNDVVLLGPADDGCSF